VNVVTLIAILLIIFSPLALDFYLPAMPLMMELMGEGIAYSISSYLIGVAFGQLLCGYLSDRYGRKFSGYLGLAICGIASLALTFSDSVTSFLCLRSFQGVGSAATSVTAFALISDYFQGKEAAKQFSLLLGGLNIIPSIAPLLGALLLMVTGWQSLFFILAFLSISASILLFYLFKKLPNRTQVVTLDDEKKVAKKVPEKGFYHLTFRTYGSVCCSFLGIILAYVAVAPQIVIDVYQRSPLEFSVLFSLNAAWIMLLNFIVPSLLKRFSTQILIYVGLGCGMAGGLLLLLPALIVPAIEFMLAICVISLGFALAMGSANAKAMDCCRSQAGKAAALLGFGQMLMGALISGMIQSLPLPLKSGLGWVACTLFIALMILVRYERKQSQSSRPDLDSQFSFKREKTSKS
jgi:DHA1 family bicyclomycin/chloramphenicol resistance-like MFS transporter